MSKPIARYHAEGEEAFEPRSCRPRTSPTAIDAGTVELIVRLRQELTDQALDAGPDTIAWHLHQHHHRTVSRATISRYLSQHDLVVPEPKKRPRSSYIRCQAAMRNETWQADFTRYRLAGGTDAETLSWSDDHSRFALSVTAHARVTGPIVVSTFRAAIAVHGIPASTPTDNGMVFTTRLAGGRGGHNAFEHELRRPHIQQKNCTPNHPTTCGKVERFQQTMKNCPRAPARPADHPAALQALLDRFAAAYNHQRPHRSLPHRGHPRTHLHRPAQSPARRHPRKGHPHLRPTRPRRPIRHRHPAPGRPPPPHRRRPNLRPNLRAPARRRPARPHRQRRHGELLPELTIDPTRDYQPQTNSKTTKPSNP
ncbi:integrase core domain-containing protein [Nonomuraea angiospora]